MPCPPGGTVDAADLKSAARKGVGVQVPRRACRRPAGRRAAAPRREDRGPAVPPDAAAPPSPADTRRRPAATRCAAACSRRFPPRPSAGAGDRPPPVAAPRWPPRAAAAARIRSVAPRRRAPRPAPRPAAGACPSSTGCRCGCGRRSTSSTSLRAWRWRMARLSERFEAEAAASRRGTADLGALVAENARRLDAVIRGRGGCARAARPAAATRQYRSGWTRRIEQLEALGERRRVTCVREARCGAPRADPARRRGHGLDAGRLPPAPGRGSAAPGRHVAWRRPGAAARAACWHRCSARAARSSTSARMSGP